MAVLNLKPDFEGSVMTPVIGMDAYPEVSYSNASGNLSFNGLIFNYSNAPVKIKVGFEAINEKGESFYAGASNSFSELDVLGYLQTFSRKFVTKLEDGEYKVYPAYATMVDNNEEIIEWHRVLMPVECPQYFHLLMANGKGTITALDNLMTLTAEDFTIDGPTRVNFPMQVSAKIVNTSDVKEARDEIKVIILKQDGSCAFMSTDYPVNIPSGESIEFSTYITPNMNSGEYKVVLGVNAVANPFSYDPLCEPVTFTLSPGCSNITLVPETFDISTEMTDEGALVTISTDVKCTEGYYANSLRFWIGEDNNWGYYTASNQFMLEEEESKNIVVKIPYPEGYDGETKTILSNYVGIKGNYVFYEKKDFTIGKSGLENKEDICANKITITRDGREIVIKSAETIKDVRIYTISGSLVVAKQNCGEKVTIDIQAANSYPCLVKITTDSSSQIFKVLK